MFVAAVFTAAGCGEAGDDVALQDEIDEVTAERDARAERVDELEAQLGGTAPATESSTADDDSAAISAASGNVCPVGRVVANRCDR